MSLYFRQRYQRICVLFKRCCGFLISIRNVHDRDNCHTAPEAIQHTDVCYGVSQASGRRSIFSAKFRFTIL